tara:strand:+ start:3481 stop:4137 length:657 start_codon:yes stop_codon:yes gene_type:complete
MKILNPTYLRALSTIQAPKKARHAHLDGVQVVQDATLNGTLTYTTTNGQVLVRVTHQNGANFTMMDRSDKAACDFTVWMDRETIKQIPTKATAEYIREYTKVDGEHHGVRGECAVIIRGNGSETRLTPSELASEYPDCERVISSATQPGTDTPELNVWIDPALCAGVMAACGKLGAETMHLEQPGGPGTPMVLTGTCGDDDDTVLALVMPMRTPDSHR